MLDKSPVYWSKEFQAPVIRASHFGQCLQALGKHFLDYKVCPPPRGLQKASAGGNILEPAVVSKLEELGFEIVDSQREVVYQLPCGIYLCGHIDGIISRSSPRHEWNGKPALLEIKSRNLEWYNAHLSQGFAAIPEMAWQLGAYVRGLETQLGRDVDVVVVVVLREDVLFTEENITEAMETLHLEYVSSDRLPTFHDLNTRAIKLFTALAEDRLPECSGSRLPCPFVGCPAGKGPTLQPNASRRKKLEERLQAFRTAK